MKKKKKATDYWFTIEPYVYVGLTKQCALLYNTLDGVTIESDESEVIELLHELLQKENCGVVLLTEEKYQNKHINFFISELQKKYMGDIIDVALSDGKPFQLLPYFNFSDKHEVYNFYPNTNVLEYLSEISIYIDHTINITLFISFLKSLPDGFTFNIIGNIEAVKNYRDLLSFLDQQSSLKNIICSYTNVIALQPAYMNNFAYTVSVHFPIDKQQWNDSRQILLNQTLPIEYVFEVSSEEDYSQAEQLIDRFQIEKHQIKPIYNGINLEFFEENVFLSKEDILSSSLSIKDFFAHRSINIYNFGKINIMPNGDAYANIHYTALGNIYTDNISEIIHNELEKGKSWFCIRNQAPCNNCIYQWLCPSPSDYEIAIGRPNLCHVK